MENPATWNETQKAINESIEYGNPDSQLVATKVVETLYFKGFIPMGGNLKLIISEFETILHRHYLPEQRMMCGLSLPSKLYNKLTEIIKPI